MASELVVANWNMNQRQTAWSRLNELRDNLGVQVALVQEAVPPAEGDWTTHPDSRDRDLWQLKAHADRQRRWASAVVLLDRRLTMTPVEPVALGQAEYGKFAVSHPGQFSVAEIELPEEGETITVISMYGVWDRDERFLFSEATLHRAISDLTILLQEKKRHNILMAGDLNIFVDWSKSSADGWWAPRMDSVFTRLEAYGLTLDGPFSDTPLPRCLCGRGDDCRHVRTYAHNSNPKNNVNQLDYVLSSEAVRVISCQAIDDAAAWQFSDHLPVASQVELGA